MNPIVKTVALMGVAIACVTYLDASAAVADAKAAWYARWYDVISHRLAEGTVAVVSFAAAGFFFSACEAVTGRKLKTTLLAPSGKTEANRPALRFRIESAVSRKATFLPSSDLASFGFWFAVNVGIYLGLIDLSQRLLGDDMLASLHFADPSPCSFGRIAFEVMFSVWAYDFIFWWIHRSWHSGAGTTKRESWKRLHLLHHDHYRATQEPLSVMNTFHHHLFDAAAQVCINIVVQQIPLAFLFSGPRHKLSKLAHNVVVTWLLVEAHSGLDLPFMSHRLLPSLFGGSVRHQIHHQVGRVYYHQFFTYLDDWMGPRAEIVTVL